MTKTVQQAPWCNAIKQPPEKIGLYRVRNRTRTHHRSRHCLVGHAFRYWDGKRWTWVSLVVNGVPKKFNTTIFGTHESHEWAGLVEEVKYGDKHTITGKFIGGLQGGQ